MANNALASGSVVLTANADQMTKGLADAEKKAVQSFEHTQQKLNKAAQKYMKHEGGFLGAVGGGFLSDVGLGGLAAGTIGGMLAMQQMAKLTRELAGYSEEFSRALEKSSKLSEELAKSMDRVTANQKEWVDTSADAGSKQEKLTSEIARMETELKGVVRQAGDAERALKALDLRSSAGNLRDWMAGGTGLTGGLEELRKEPAAMLKEASDKASKLRDSLAGARKSLLDLTDPESNPKMKAFNDAMEKMRNEFFDVGASPLEKFLAPFQEMGLSEEKLRRLSETFYHLQERKEEFANRPVSTNLPIWMSAMIGLTSEVGKELEYMAKWGEKAMEPMKLAGAVEAGSREGYSLSVKNQFGGDSGTDRIVNAVKDGTKQMTDILKAIGIVI